LKESTAVPVETDTATANTVDEPTEEAETDKPVDAQSTDEPADADDAEGESADAATEKSRKTKRGIRWIRVLACGILPGLALLLALGAGYLKWQDSSVRQADIARIESVRAAKDGTVALLSYRPGTVEKDLGAARDRLTGQFRDSYTSLTNDVVIPGAKQKQISAVVTVPAAASVSASPNHAVVLVCVNQTVVVGSDAPTSTASSVRVTLEKSADRWLISGFDPV
jgi:Mce-associated membrane protein